MKASSVQEFELSGDDVRNALTQWIAQRADCQFNHRGKLSGDILISEPQRVSGEATYDKRFKIDQISSVHMKVTDTIKQKTLRGSVDLPADEG